MVLGHVGEDEVLEADVGDDPSGVEDRPRSCARAPSSGGRCGSLGPRPGRAGIDRRSRRGPVSSLWLGQQLVDGAGELHPAVGHDDEVVADPLDVGEQVRRQDDGRLPVGDRAP